MVSLYYKPLTSHMKKFRKNLNLQEINDEIHNIALKEELNKDNALINTAAKQLRLEQLKNELRAKLLISKKQPKFSKEYHENIENDKFQTQLEKQKLADKILNNQIKKFTPSELQEIIIHPETYPIQQLSNELKEQIKNYQKKYKLPEIIIHNNPKPPKMYNIGYQNKLKKRSILKPMKEEIDYNNPLGFNESPIYDIRKAKTYPHIFPHGIAPSGEAHAKRGRKKLEITQKQKQQYLELLPNAQEFKAQKNQIKNKERRMATRVKNFYNKRIKASAFQALKSNVTKEGSGLKIKKSHNYLY